MLHCTDEKKMPTGDSNHPAGSTDTAKFTAMARLLALRDTINTAVLRAWRASPSAWSRGTIRPGARNTFIESAVAAPTESGASSRSDFADAGNPASHGLGRGGLVRKAGRMADSMFRTPRPPVARRKAAGGYQSQSGATMHHTTTASASARTPTSISGTAHTTLDNTGEKQAFALLQATSDATMAKLYLSKGNIAGARRKAVQLLKALQALEVQA